MRDTNKDQVDDTEEMMILGAILPILISTLRIGVGIIFMIVLNFEIVFINLNAEIKNKVKEV